MPENELEFEKEYLDASSIESRPLRSAFKATQIVNAAGSIFHVNPEGILSGATDKTSTEARHAATYVIDEEIDPVLHWLGRFMGRHHTTVMYGLEKVRNEIVRDGVMAQKIRIIRASYKNMPGDHLITINQPPRLSLEKIKGVVATVFMVNTDRLAWENLTWASNFPHGYFLRWIIIYLLHEVGGWPIPDIAEHFSQRHRSTQEGYERIKASMTDDPWMRFLVHALQDLCLEKDKAPVG